MILELDCGNSFIKWRVVSGANKAVLTEGIATHVADVVRDLLDGRIGKITRCRLVSVRSDAETTALVHVLSEALGVNVARARPADRFAGVVNGYRDQQRLGLDRWLAVLAAYDLCRGACLVIDLGTAITVDLVACDGVHLGGYIAPGIALLRAQLVDHTRRIRYDVAEAALALSDVAPGRSTAEAVERGCLIMVRSYLSSQISFANSHLGDDFTIYVTGGDAAIAADLPGVRCVPDLVFRGLAIACP
ncbi:type III pantothenate kinase [Pseudomonas sp. KSR10]|jgi:type III pantothenate kinase|uniref:Type III pantothenate kinase n=1 Tax=Stutzerimonas stutzeri TaxID=316 RepID=A0A0D9ATV6_STUST|nr:MULTISPECIES: type III pantothenate kinase [Pseudomonadaceae]KJH84134.1 pantothenate kinase [Stutzerimonas stutzeri]MCG6539596.1 type III pantothenate kinase [Pseudomonas sp. KSR10]